MAQLLQVTFDCADVPAMVRFWSAVLGYEQQPPPPPFGSWAELRRRPGRPGRAARLPGRSGGPAWREAPAVLPAGAGGQDGQEPHAPRRAVDPAGRAAAAWPPRWTRVVGLGAERLDEFDEMGSHWVVMRDPEGNEFCILRDDDCPRRHLAWTPTPTYARKGSSWTS